MNCDDIEARLADWLYGECSAEEERARIRAHLADCPACRGRADELEECRRALGAIDGGGGAVVDLGRLYRAAAHRSDRRARVWRLASAAAVALCVPAVAFAVLCAELEWRPEGLTIRWGRSVVPGNPPGRDVEAALDARSARLEALEDLVRAAVTDMEAGRQGFERGLAQVERRLMALERRSAERLRQLDDDVRAIYLTRFVEGGEEETRKER